MDRGIAVTGVFPCRSGLGNSLVDDFPLKYPLKEWYQESLTYDSWSSPIKSLRSLRSPMVKQPIRFKACVELSSCAGCDGTETSRSYFTDLANDTPEVPGVNAGRSLGYVEKTHSNMRYMISIYNIYTNDIMYIYMIWYRDTIIMGQNSFQLACSKNNQQRNMLPIKYAGGSCRLIIEMIINYVMQGWNIKIMECH